MKFTRKTDISEIYRLYTEGEDWSDEPLPQSGGPIRRHNKQMGYRPGDVQRSKSTDGRVNVSGDELHHLIKHQWVEGKQDKRIAAVLVYGEMGIGKTEIPEAASAEIANAEGRQFVRFEKIGLPNQPTAEQIFKEPHKWFVFMDISTTEMDPTDLQGLPAIGDKGDYTKMKPMEWVKYLVHNDDLAGLLFFDEIGHARGDVKNVMFRVIQQRRVGNQVMIPNFMIVAGANLPDPLSGSEPLPAPLVGRFRVTQLIPDPKSWAVWARKNYVHDYVIGFANHEPDMNFYIGPVDEDSRAFPNPRSVARFGIWLTKHEKINEMWLSMDAGADIGPGESGDAMTDAIQNMLGDAIKHNTLPWLKTAGNANVVDPVAYWEFAYRIAKAECGEEWGDRFQTFIESYHNVNIDDYLKDPAKLKSNDTDAYDFLIVCMKSSEMISKIWEDTIAKFTPDQQVDSVEAAFDWADANMAQKIDNPPKHSKLNQFAQMFLPEFIGDDQRVTLFLQIHNKSPISGVLFHQYLVWADLGDYQTKELMTGKPFATALEQAKSGGNTDPDYIDTIEFTPDSVVETLNQVANLYSQLKNQR